MSPWGKFYLEKMSYRPAWFVVFESWRMWGIMDRLLEHYGPIDSPQWFRMQRHLDRLESYLNRFDQHGSLVFEDPQTRGW